VPKLNKEQEEAASFVEGVAAVIAVPGSGKTLTMTERIGILVKEHGVAPENILGLTFTRNAAQAMRDKLLPVLNEQANRVSLLTIHSFCHFLLRSEGRSFEILTGKDQIVFLKKIMQKHRVKDLSTGMVLREISLAKNNLISVEEFMVLHEGDKTMAKIGGIYEAYDRQKSKKLLLDFDDLLFEVYKLLNERDEVRFKYNQIYNHILVDEFQDTNIVQMEILRLLMEKSNEGSSFFVVGDDWQSIYAFTGATVANILNFERMFPESKQFILKQNYRSTPQILKACMNLIQHNQRKIEKSLETQNEDGEQVIVLESSNEEGEALNMVSEISDLVQRRGFAHKDIAVLYRCNFQSRVIEEVFSRLKVPFHIENGTNFYHRTEVRVLLDYLRLIANPDSEQGDEAFLRIINIPNRYMGKKFTADLEQFASKRGIHLYEALKESPVEVPYLRKYIKEFVHLMDPLIPDREILEPADAISLLRSSLDYDRVITDEDVPSPDDVKIQNINQLQLSTSRYRDIESFLNYTDTFQDESANDKEGVALMTIHKSKGLEFPVVFIPGLVEGITPTKKGDIEEERRIVFVGCSRAMKVLYLSYSLNFLGVPAKKSIFIDELLGAK
jgi:DNA helicase-2/ATP-dependent DNA helicase PcrA